MKDPEEVRLKVKPERFARASGQPAPSTKQPEKLEEGTGSLPVSRSEQGQLSLVNGSREITLGTPLGSTKSELVGGCQSEVILGAGSLNRHVNAIWRKIVLGLWTGSCGA